MAQRPSSSITLLSTILFFSLLHTATANWTNGGSPRFTRWFPHSAEDFAAISTGVCNASLSAFEAAYAASPSRAAVNLGSIPRNAPAVALCRQHASCILSNVSEMTKASLTTAGVVLGLLPTLLAVFSPSLSELVLLSSQRPALATLLSVGAPGVLQRRVFEYEDPFELIEAPEAGKGGTRSPLVLGPWGRGRSILTAAVQWLLAAACAVNTVALAVETGNNSIISWGCTRTWPLILWVCVPTIIHWIGAVGYRLALDRSCSIPHAAHARGEKHDGKRESSSAASAAESGKALTHVSSMCISKHASTATASAPTTTSGKLLSWLRRETTSCASHSAAFTLQHPLEDSSTRAHAGVVLHCAATFLSFFHVLYGTVVFSALLFIDNRDALGQMVTRCIASAIICRMLVLIDMGGLRGAVLAANKRE